MKVIWSRRAISHLRKLRGYIEQDNPKAANQVAKRILESVERLEKFPNAGRPGRIAGTRELVIPRTPYLIPYRIRRQTVEIIAVFYGRQRWRDRL
jgi:toxin ParE1/3/4